MKTAGRKHAGESDGKGGDEAATKDDMTRKIHAKRRMDANNSWRVSELQAADCKEGRGGTQDGRMRCCDGTVCCTK